MNQFAPTISSRLDAGSLLFWVSAILLWTALFLTEHKVDTSRQEAFGTTTEELESMAASGKLLNKIGFGLVAAVGMICLASRSDRTSNLVDIGSVLILMYLGWCFLSVMWSDDPRLTLRRFGVLAWFRARADYLATGDFGVGFVHSLMLYGGTDGLMESGFTAPSFLTMIAVTGWFQYTFFHSGMPIAASRPLISNRSERTNASTVPNTSVPAW